MDIYSDNAARENVLSNEMNWRRTVDSVKKLIQAPRNSAASSNFINVRNIRLIAFKCACEVPTARSTRSVINSGGTT
jgi:hypothetical protein